MHTIHVVSGATGASGEQVARTVLAQFHTSDATVKVSGRIRDLEALHKLLDEVDVGHSTIVHTLVSEPLRKAMADYAERRGLVAIDLVGDLIDRLAWALNKQPLGMPGRYRQSRAEYFGRIEAIEYAVEHDDGRNADEWPSANVVLTGPSRVGKTPLCIYLASQGWKAANFPLIQQVRPPDMLYELPTNKVVGLTIRPDRLLEHRLQRAQRLGLKGPSRYEDPLEIEDDLRYTRKLFRRLGLATVDVTDKPVEEIAREVMERVRR